ncbi:MAG TPA: T9SS type A sorting domain-containing protein [Puia sp.]|nr:T9SS type A sorting domain-containing protein [Puia sp.]
MRKLILLTSLSALLCSALPAQTFPANFSWLPANFSKEDQIVALGPCNVFATIAGLEAWLQVLYGQPIALSQQTLYSHCVVGFGPANTNIKDGLAYLLTTGAPTTAEVPYGNLTTDDCITATNCGDPYYGGKEGPAPMYSVPCVNPLNVSPYTSYQVASYQSIDLTNLYPSYTTYNNYQRLQRAILNYGPIMLSMTTPSSGSYSLHCGATHAYVLFGWKTVNGQIQWRLKDSWPGTDGIGDPCSAMSQAESDYGVDLIAGIKGSQIVTNQGVYILVPTVSGGVITRNAVYPSTGSAPPIVPWPESVSGNNLAISFPLPDNYLSSKYPLPASITNLGNLDPGYTVSWASIPAHPGATASVTFDNPNSPTPNVSPVVQGYARMQATVTMANGIQQSMVSDSFFVCPGMPIIFKQIFDLCSGSTRSVRWQIVSQSNSLLPSNLQITWNYTFGTNPSPFLTFSTSDFPNDIITIDFPNLTHPTGYYLDPTFVDPNYHNITDGTDQSATESSCSSGHSMAPSLENGNDSVLMAAPKPFTVYPNPSSGLVNIQLPAGKNYIVKVHSADGTLIKAQTVSGSAALDLTGHAKGVYLVQVLPADPGERPVVYKLILF